MCEPSDKCIFEETIRSYGDRPCGCKGIRTCLLCEKELINQINQSSPKQSQQNNKPKECYIFCSQCGSKAWLNDDHALHNDDEISHQHANNALDDEEAGNITFNNRNPSRPLFINIQGIVVIENVISEQEENQIISKIDDPATPSPWTISVSGRRKQDYGPKVNFKKQKVKTNGFHGLPDYGHKLISQIVNLTTSLNNFIPVELCNLEYVPERGSSIDPHLDDDWLWGERLVTINLISSTRLTLSPVKHTSSTYSVEQSGNMSNQNSVLSDAEIEILLPARSLLVLFGEARFKWLHAIKRQHITSRRVGITIRELTPLFLPGGQLYHSIGKQILEIARKELSC